MIRHSELPSIADAEFPVLYEKAKIALKKCKQLDECKDWADKAQAMASYAKQSKDNAMLNAALAIQYRATTRCGELLKEIPKQQGGDHGNQHTGGKRGGDPRSASARQQAAEDAGLSPDQAKNAIRLANIPEEEFDALVDSENPPTLTELAELGKKRGKPMYEQIGVTIEEFQAASAVQGALRTYLKAIEDCDPGLAAKGLTESERDDVYENVIFAQQFNKNLKDWLCSLETND